MTWYSCSLWCNHIKQFSFIILQHTRNKQKPGLCSQYSGYATRLDDQGIMVQFLAEASNSPFLQSMWTLPGTLSLLFTGNCGYSNQGMMVTIHLPLVQRLRINSTIPPCIHPCKGATLPLPSQGGEERLRAAIVCTHSSKILMKSQKICHTHQTMYEIRILS